MVLAKGYNKGRRLFRRVKYNKYVDKMAAPNNAYYVLTTAHLGLPNSVVHNALSGTQLHSPKAHTHVEADITDLDHYTTTDFNTDFAASDLNDLGTKSHTNLDDIGTTSHEDIDTHIGDTANPHSTTLDLAFDAGKIINGANSYASRMQIGNATQHINIFNSEYSDGADISMYLMILGSSTYHMNNLYYSGSAYVRPVSDKEGLMFSTWAGTEDDSYFQFIKMLETDAFTKHLKIFPRAAEVSLSSDAMIRMVSTSYATRFRAGGVNDNINFWSSGGTGIRNMYLHNTGHIMYIGRNVYHSGTAWVKDTTTETGTMMYIASSGTDHAGYFRFFGTLKAAATFSKYIQFQFDATDTFISSNGIINIQPTGSATIGDGGTTNYASFGADGTLSLLGTAKVLRSSWVPAQSIKAPLSRPAAYVDHGISGAWEFDDQALEVNTERIVCNIGVPFDMDVSVVPVLNIGWSSTTTSADCNWEVQYLWTAEDEETTAAAQETLTQPETSSGTAEGLIVSSFTLEAADAADKCLHIQITRRSDSGDDTIDGDTVELHGICLQYTSNKLGT